MQETGKTKRKQRAASYTINKVSAPQPDVLSHPLSHEEEAHHTSHLVEYVLIT